MAIDFPNAPVVDDEFVATNGVTYVWNGTYWAILPGSSGGGGGGGLDQATADVRYVNAIGDVMTGNLAMTGPGIGVNYDPPTTLLFGAWEAVAGTPDNIAFGFDGTNLRVRVNDVDIGNAGGSGGGSVGATPPANPAVGDLWWDVEDGNLAIYYNDGTSQQWVPATSTVGNSGLTQTDADANYVNVVGDAMTGDLEMTGADIISTGAGIGVSYDPPTTLVYGPWQKVPVAFGFDGTNIRMRVQDTDIGVLKKEEPIGCLLEFRFTGTSDAPIGTIYNFAVPALSLPTNDCYLGFGWTTPGIASDSYDMYMLNDSAPVATASGSYDVFIEGDMGAGFVYNLIGILSFSGGNPNYLNPLTTADPMRTQTYLKYVAGLPMNIRLVKNNPPLTPATDLPIVIGFRFRTLANLPIQTIAPTVQLPTIGTAPARRR